MRAAVYLYHPWQRTCSRCGYEAQGLRAAVDANRLEACVGERIEGGARKLPPVFLSSSSNRLSTSISFDHSPLRCAQMDGGFCSDEH